MPDLSDPALRAFEAWWSKQLPDYSIAHIRAAWLAACAYQRERDAQVAESLRAAEAPDAELPKRIATAIRRAAEGEKGKG